MIWNDTASLLRLATIVSGVSSATFGLMGVATESRRGQKLTVFGWIAMIGIVLSTACSMWIDTLKSKQEAQADEKRRSHEDSQFQKQIGRLESIGRNVGASLREGEQARADQAKGTKSVLSSVWDDANRVRPSSVLLLSSVDCNGMAVRHVPDLFGPEALAEVRLEPASAFTRSRKDAKRLDPDGVLSAKLGFALVAPRSYDVESSGGVTPRAGGDIYEATKLMTFSEVATDLSRLAKVDQWRDHVVEVIVHTDNRITESEAKRSFPLLGDPAAFIPNAMHVPAIAKDIIRQLPCTADMTLSINGRTIAEAAGSMFFTIPWKDGDENNEGRIFIKYPVVPVRSAGLPSLGF